MVRVSRRDPRGDSRSFLTTNCNERLIHRHLAVAITFEHLLQTSGECEKGLSGPRRPHDRHRRNIGIEQEFQGEGLANVPRLDAETRACYQAPGSASWGSSSAT